MCVYACVCMRAGEKERDCFQNNHVFLSREIGPASLATKGESCWFYVFVFSDKILSNLFRALSFSSLLSLPYPNPIWLSGTDRNFCLFSFWLFLVLSGSVFAFACLASCLFVLFGVFSPSLPSYAALSSLIHATVRLLRSSSLRTSRAMPLFPKTS